MKKSVLLYALLFCVLQTNSQPVFAQNLPPDDEAQEALPAGTIQDGEYLVYTRRTGFEFDVLGSIVITNYASGAGFSLRGIQWLDPHFGLGGSLSGYGFGYGGAYVLTASMKYALEGRTGVRPYALGGLGIASTGYPAAEVGFGFEWLAGPTSSFFFEFKPSVSAGYYSAVVYVPISVGVAFGSPRESFRYRDPEIAWQEEAEEAEEEDAEGIRKWVDFGLMGGLVISANRYSWGLCVEAQGTFWLSRRFGVGISGAAYRTQRIVNRYAAFPVVISTLEEEFYMVDLSAFVKIPLGDRKRIHPYLLGSIGAVRDFSAAYPDENLYPLPKGGVGVEFPLGDVKLAVEVKGAFFDWLHYDFFPVTAGVVF